MRVPIREDGFSVIEVVVALAVLALVLLGFMATTAPLARTADDSARRVAAIELARARLQEIAVDPDYDGLEARYEGVEPTIPGFPGFRRTTTIVRVVEPRPNGRRLDYQRVTVSVEGPGLQTPVRRTATVAAP